MCENKIKCIFKFFFGIIIIISFLIFSFSKTKKKPEKVEFEYFACFCTKIRQENFWQKWYDIELKKNEKNKDDVEFKQNIMYDICKTLIQLELPKTMVKNFTDSINVKEFGKGSELQVATFRTFIKFIQSANYISKAF